ncbi:MAG: spore protease YyaC [Firmicutes bacterium]|nr:spore protease YyaC [Bacillota bacterium]
MAREAWFHSGWTSVRTRVDDPRCHQELLTGFIRLWTHWGLPDYILCVGTDRATGDAFGPLVGSRLMEWGSLPSKVLGSLDAPLHAGNLTALLKARPYLQHARCLAVDASLGLPEEVGAIALGVGAIRPGAGVRKDLPPIGRYFVTATVNIGGFMDSYVLQNTRLGLVMRMADAVARALALSLRVDQAP